MTDKLIKVDAGDGYHVVSGCMRIGLVQPIVVRTRTNNSRVDGWLMWARTGSGCARYELIGERKTRRDAVLRIFKTAERMAL